MTRSPCAAQTPSSAELVAAAAWSRAVCGSSLPSITATIALLSASEIFGYSGIWGLAFLTLDKLSMNVLTPGSFAFICCVTLAFWATEARVGRSPVSNEKVFTCAGAVSHVRKSRAAVLRAVPLSKTTQLSGPAID
jgi:hypothetical protein